MNLEWRWVCNQTGRQGQWKVSSAEDEPMACEKADGKDSTHNETVKTDETVGLGTLKHFLRTGFVI